MPETRRHLLGAMAAFAAGVISNPVFASQAGMQPQPMPSPNAPGNQNVPAGLDRAGVDAGELKSKITPLAWSQIRTDVDKLFQMTSDLKEHVSQTNLASTLPLPLIKETHQIEKLAKQIQDHMKG